MMNEKMLTKIRNLFDLSKNNPNENEAIAAAMKAQELMAKYDIGIAEVEGVQINKEIAHMVYSNTEKHEMKKWKLSLCTVIAPNFKCRVYVHNKTDVVFYGYKDDATVALETFSFLYNTGNKLAVKYYNQMKKVGKSTKGVMNNYLMGFVSGIREALDTQCTALMIVVPKEVNESFDGLSSGWSTKKHSMKYNSKGDAYQKGKLDGKDVMSTKQIAS